MQTQDIEKLTNTQHEIIQQLGIAFELSNAEFGYQPILGSWGDTLLDSEILEQLIEMNQVVRESQ